MVSGVHDGNRDASFQLISGVVLFGGHAGFGAANPDERDAASYVTVLSGDLGDYSGFVFVKDQVNSYHVVVANGVDADTVLDGFTITGGKALGSELQGLGGGMLITQGMCQVVNCVLTGNAADFGGALYERWW